MVGRLWLVDVRIPWDNVEAIPCRKEDFHADVVESPGELHHRHLEEHNKFTLVHLYIHVQVYKQRPWNFPLRNEGLVKILTLINM